jgi:hypothetical protein
VRFAKHDHVVETFAADRADESLNVSILPGRSGCDRMVTNAHCTDPLQEGWTIRGVSIPNEISRGAVPDPGGVRNVVPVVNLIRLAGSGESGDDVV